MAKPNIFLSKLLSANVDLFRTDINNMVFFLNGHPADRIRIYHLIYLDFKYK